MLAADWQLLIASISGALFSWWQKIDVHYRFTQWKNLLVQRRSAVLVRIDLISQSANIPNSFTLVCVLFNSKMAFVVI